MSKGQQNTLFKFEEKSYCIDTSSIINLFRYYPKDIFEGLWNRLEELIQKGLIISHETVLKELEKKDDEVKDWCKNHKKIFKGIDECLKEKFKEVKKKYSNSYWNAEINRNNEWADPWLIALAICKGAKIISDEVNKPDRIPYVANHFKVETLNLIAFFREQKLKF